MGVIESKEENTRKIGENTMIIKSLQIPHHGRAVNGNLYLPKEEGRFPLIIMGHGYNGSKMDFDVSAKFLAEHHIASFLYDFCGGSTRDESSMKTTEMTIFTEKEDLNAVLDASLNWENIDPQNIFLFGASQGGLVSALTADERMDSLRGLILLFPALCIADDWNKRFKTEEEVPEEEELWGMKLGKVFFMSLRGYDVLKHLGKFDKKVLIMHGDQDSIVPLDYSKRAQRAYSDAQLEVFRGEGHGFTPEGDQKMIEMILKFIQEEICG